MLILHECSGLRSFLDCKIWMTFALLQSEEERLQPAIKCFVQTVWRNEEQKWLHKMARYSYRVQDHSLSKARLMKIKLFLFFYFFKSCWSFCLFLSPWYNRNGWLGIKHQVSYLLVIFLQKIPQSISEFSGL